MNDKILLITLFIHAVLNNSQNFLLLRKKIKVHNTVFFENNRKRQMKLNVDLVCVYSRRRMKRKKSTSIDTRDEG